MTVGSGGKGIFLRRPRQVRRGRSAFGARQVVLVLLGIALLGLATMYRPQAQGQPAAPPPTAAPTQAPASAQHPVPAQPPAPSQTPSALRTLARTIAPASFASGPAPTRRPGTADPEPSTQRFVVMDGDSGAILFQRNAFEPVAPASLTKIMTAILGVERGNLSDRPRLSVDARTFSDSTVMGLEPWFDLTLEDLLYGLMLPSGNDAAAAIAQHVAGNEAAFVRLMNEKAAWLGLQATHFANPHGLDTTDHYSSPYDMAVMARYGMQYEEFRKLASAKYYTIRQKNVSYAMENMNPMLWAYPGADGVKIGYTDAAGRAMAATAVRDGHRLYVAFMKSRMGLVPDTTLLLDWGFSAFVWP